jgi:hypothetical protein
MQHKVQIFKTTITRSPVFDKVTFCAKPCKILLNGQHIRFHFNVNMTVIEN